MSYRHSHRTSPDERHARRAEERERKRRSSPGDGRMQRERSRSPPSRSRGKDQHSRHRDVERRKETQESLPHGGGTSSCDHDRREGGTSSRDHDKREGEIREQHVHRLDRERERDRDEDDARRDLRAERLHRRERETEDTTEHEFGGHQAVQEQTQTREEPNFALSGKLTAETNTYKGVVIKYSEPPEARMPKTRWRLYPFRGDQALPTLYIHRQSAFLIGRDRKIVDLPVDHPSCSKQHAVLQYRLVEHQKADGTTGRKVKPYVIDLESTNGTYVNNQRIEPARYYELKEKDMIKFGFSSREYILLHENSKGNMLDDVERQT